MGFDAVRERIAMDLMSQARTNALGQYMQQLVAQATVRGIALEEAAPPLDQ